MANRERQCDELVNEIRERIPAAKEKCNKVIGLLDEAIARLDKRIARLKQEIFWLGIARWVIPVMVVGFLMTMVLLNR